MFEKTRLPEDTEKLNWEAKHVPLSVSVCSNVPGFDRPKCFVTEGDPKLLVRNMLYYLVEISQESYRLVKEQFADVLRAIEETLSALAPLEEREQHHEEQESNEEEDSEYEQDDRGIDVMNIDEEDEEEVESENEEDPSVYQR